MNYYIANGERHELEAGQTNLTDLSHKNLTSLVVVSDELKRLDCSYNQLTELQLNCPVLETLYCHNNQLTELQVDCPALKRLDCSYNQLTELQLDCPVLETLYCHNNQLTELQLDCPALEWLDCHSNQLTELQLDCPALEWLDCSNNQLTELQVDCPALKRLYCHNNQLTELQVDCPVLYRLWTDNIDCIFNGRKALGIDGYPTYIDKTYEDGKFTIHEGSFTDGNKTFVAIRGKYSAHGQSKEKAKSDCHFKYLSETLDVTEWVAKIKKAGVISKMDYRLLTGSCEQGVERFLSEHNMSNVTELPLDQAIELVQGSYGSGRINELFK